MEENSKLREDPKELTPEELDEVAGGIPAAETDDKHNHWIEVTSFQWGGQ